MTVALHPLYGGWCFGQTVGGWPAPWIVPTLASQGGLVPPALHACKATYYQIVKDQWGVLRPNVAGNLLAKPGGQHRTGLRWVAPNTLIIRYF